MVEGLLDLEVCSNLGDAMILWFVIDSSGKRNAREITLFLGWEFLLLLNKKKNLGGEFL